MLTENIFHVIKDPVHGTMQFTSAEDKWIKPFIDNPTFQRLRHIKQLGMGDFIFPGAVHTRFNHSLGCSYVASQIAHKIGLAEEERQLVMIACLLHDIGHGPFSHAFEDIFYQKLIRHETWTPFFLAKFRTSEFFNYYNRINPRHQLTAEKFSLIEHMIMHKGNTNRVLSDIVSSQLDADRLDYLLRDSHFCGVAYGQFDFRWMLHCLAIVNSKEGERLGLTYKGIGVVEHYLMARRLMTRNIYHHHKKLVLEFYLIKLLTYLAESLSDYSSYSTIKKTALGKFLLAVNQFNHTISHTKNVSAHKQQFLTDNFSNYQELGDYDVFTIIKLLADMDDEHPASQLALRIRNRNIPKIFRLEGTNIKTTQTKLDEFKHSHCDIFQDWQLAIIKTPHQAYTLDEPILVLDENGNIKPIDELSLMIQAISDKYENTAFLCVDSSVIDSPKISQFLKTLSKKPATTV